MQVLLAIFGENGKLRCDSAKYVCLINLSVNRCNSERWNTSPGIHSL